MSETKKIKTALVSVYHKDGLDAILCSYGVSMSGVDMVGTQCYVFGRDYTDILTLTSVSGAYDDDFEACLKSISMH